LKGVQIKFENIVFSLYKDKKAGTQEDTPRENSSRIQNTENIDLCDEKTGKDKMR
jgi:hypothetical protein